MAISARTTLRIKTVPRTNLRDKAYIALPRRSVPTVVRWSLFLFVFTIPFEDSDVGFMSGSLSPAKISGFLFFAIYCFYYSGVSSKRSFSRPPGAMWWFLGYLTVYILNGSFIPRELLSSFLSRLLTLLQLMVLFWITSSLLENGKVVKNVLLSFSLSSVILAVAMIFGLFGIEVTDLGQGRVTALEYNPGTLGVLMAVAMIMLIGMHLNAARKEFMSNILSLALAAPLLTAMLKTGSRGALAALMVGCLMYILPNVRGKFRWSAIIIAVTAIIAVLYMAASDPDYAERWEQTYYERNVSGRDQIYSVSVEMILERPIFGWHPVAHWRELGSRLGLWERDEHSLFLHLLAEVGVVGTVPFLIGLWLCVRAAWRARTGELGFLPLALILATLTSNITDTFIARKPLWLVLAISLAAASTVTRRKVVCLGTERLSEKI